MERRKLLQALTALPILTVKEGVKAIEVKPKKRYIAFVDGMMIDIEKFCSQPWPESFGDIEMDVHAVYRNSNQSLDDAIRIYEVNSDG
jgi:hypothetical protein